uniref:fimbrial protein n=1 Tax=Castellaniella defragrans TaxID=75697 RepID=UPI00333FA10C
MKINSMVYFGVEKMKLSHIFGLLLGIVIQGGAQVSIAADTAAVHVTGSVVNTTCKIGGGTNQNVPMPTLDAKDFSGVGSKAGVTDFNILLTGCPTQFARVGVSFDSCGTGATLVGGRCSDINNVTKLHLELRKANDDVITIGDAFSGDYFALAADGSAALPYKAAYYLPEAVAMAGTFKSVVNVNFHYEE